LNHHYIHARASRAPVVNGGFLVGWGFGGVGLSKFYNNAQNYIAYKCDLKATAAS
jgi:hypothetical protein